MASLREHAPDGAIRGQDRNKAEKPMRGAESPDYAIGRALAQLVGSRPGYEVRQEAAHWRDAVPDVSQSLSSGAHSRDPLAHPGLRITADGTRSTP
jgi:hypothetical protein